MQPQTQAPRQTALQYEQLTPEEDSILIPEEEEAEETNEENTVVGEKKTIRFDKQM
jgi:hypothetical protein